MNIFTLCNNSQESVSVKFQLKIPHGSFIIPCPFLDRSKNTLFSCLFKCK